MSVQKRLVEDGYSDSILKGMVLTVLDGKPVVKTNNGQVA